MRQIKFRAWDKEYGHMYQNAYSFEHLVYVEMFDDDETFQQFKHKMQVVNGKYFYFIIAKNMELMQFTGLQDRTGKDIYEGDILGVSGKPRTCFQIVWDDANGAWSCQDYWTTRTLLSEDPIGNDIVIGNIYEHPDLLAKEQ